MNWKHTVEYMQTKAQKDKRLNIKKRRNIWDIMKRCNCSSRKERRKKMNRNKIWRNSGQEFFKTLEGQQTSNSRPMSPNRIKMKKIKLYTHHCNFWTPKTKEILKAFRGVEKAEDFETARPTTDFWWETMGVTRLLNNSLKVIKKNNCEPRMLYSAK